MDIFITQVTLVLIVSTCLGVNQGALAPKKGSRFPAIAKMTSKSHPMLASVFASANLAKTMENNPVGIKDPKIVQLVEDINAPKGPVNTDHERTSFLEIHASIMCQLCRENNNITCIEKLCMNDGSVSIHPGTQSGTKLGPITDSTNMLPDRKHPNAVIGTQSIEGPIIIPLEPEIRPGAGLPSVLIDHAGLNHPLTEMIPDNVVIKSQVNVPVTLPSGPDLQRGVALPSVLSDPVQANHMSTEINTDTSMKASSNFLPFLPMPDNMNGKPFDAHLPHLQPFRPSLQQMNELSPFQLDSAIVKQTQTDAKPVMVERTMTDVLPLPKTFSQFLEMKKLEGQKTNVIIPSSILNTPTNDKITSDVVHPVDISPSSAQPVQQAEPAPAAESGQPSITFQDVVNLEQILADLMADSVASRAIPGERDLSVSQILTNNVPMVRNDQNNAVIDKTKTGPIVSPDISAQSSGNSNFFVPADFDLGLSIPDGLSEVPLDPAGFNTVPLDPAGLNVVPIDPVGLNAKSMNPVELNVVPIDPVGFDAAPINPVGLNPVPIDPVQTNTVPLDSVGINRDQMDPAGLPTGQLDPITPRQTHANHGHSHTDNAVMSNELHPVVSVVSAGEPEVFARERQRQMIEASEHPTTISPIIPQEEATTPIVTMSPIRKAELEAFAKPFLPTKL